MKSLEKGRFALPKIPEGASEVVLDATSLTMLLDGIDLRVVKRTPMWTPAKTAGESSKGIDIRRHA